MSRSAVRFMAIRRGPVPEDTRPQAAARGGSALEAPVEPDAADPDGTSDTPTSADDTTTDSTQEPDTATSEEPPDDDVDAQAAALIQDGATLDAIVEWATGNPDRIAAVLAAEAASDKPRKTLPGRLAPTKENG